LFYVDGVDERTCNVGVMLGAVFFRRKSNGRGGGQLRATKTERWWWSADWQWQSQVSRLQGALPNFSMHTFHTL